MRYYPDGVSLVLAGRVAEVPDLHPQSGTALKTRIDTRPFSAVCILSQSPDSEPILTLLNNPRARIRRRIAIHRKHRPEVVTEIAREHFEDTNSDVHE
jgi:hypothetical protein